MVYLNTFKDNKQKGWKKYHLNKLLLFGISCLVYSFFFFFSNASIDIKDLRPVIGNVKDVDMDIEEVYSRSRYGIKHKNKSASLTFSLYDSNKKFVILENIGQEYEHPPFLKLLERLNKATNVSVWVKSEEMDKISPEVFRIDINNTTVLSIDDTQDKNKFVFFFLFFLGLGTTVFCLKEKFPTFFYKLWN